MQKFLSCCSLRRSFPSKFSKTWKVLNFFQDLENQVHFHHSSNKTNCSLYLRQVMSQFCLNKFIFKKFRVSVLFFHVTVWPVAVWSLGKFIWVEVFFPVFQWFPVIFCCFLTSFPTVLTVFQYFWWDIYKWVLGGPEVISFR